MFGIIKNINREDLYNGIIPFITFILPFIYFNFLKPRKETGWKLSVQRGSYDRYVSYLMRVIFGMFIYILLYTFLTLLILAAIFYNTDFKISNIFISVVFTIITVIWCVLVVINIKISKKEEIIVLKNHQPNKKIISRFLLYFPPLFTAFLLISSIFLKIPNIISTIIFIFCLIYLIVPACILDNNPKYEYMYMCFCLDDEMRIENIKTENVKKEGTWIVVKDELNNEIRFKNENIKRIEYKN